MSKAKHPKPLRVLAGYKNILEKPVWGPVFWKILHHRAKEHGLTERWLDGFQAAIMCPMCKDHFRLLRERYPRHLFKNDEAWAWMVHNCTNTEQSNKPFFTWLDYEVTYGDD